MTTRICFYSISMGVPLLILLPSVRSAVASWAPERVEFAPGIQPYYQGADRAGMSGAAGTAVIGDPFIHFELAGAHMASFTVLRQPEPASFALGSSFLLENVPGTFEGVDGIRSIRFFNNSLEGGFEVVGDFKVNYTQLYSGIESSPSLYSGDYFLRDSVTGTGAGLIAFPTSLPPTPEPSLGALLVLGIVGLAIGLDANRVYCGRPVVSMTK